MKSKEVLLMEIEESIREQDGVFDELSTNKLNEWCSKISEIHKQYGGLGTTTQPHLEEYLIEAHVLKQGFIIKLLKTIQEFKDE